MADIAMCEDSKCPQKDTCYRFKAIPCEFRQEYFTDSPRYRGSCKFYWKVKEK